MIPDVPLKETMWGNQRLRLRRWAEAACVHHQGRVDFAYRLH